MLIHTKSAIPLAPAGFASNVEQPNRNALVTGAIGLGGIGVLVTTSLGTGTPDQLIAVCRQPQLEAIKRDGLHRTGLLGDTSLSANRCRVFDAIGAIPHGIVFDRILIFVKSYDVEEVARELAARPDLIERDTAFFCFQNGWSTHIPLLALTDAEHIYHARVITGVHKTHPHRACVTVHQDDILIGSISPNASLEPATDLARDMTVGGVTARATPDIARFLWGKVIYNCCVNALGALNCCSTGELASDSNLRLELECLLEETFWVVERAGYATGLGSFETYREQFFGTLIPRTADHRSSMLQDLERSLPRTEIEWLNGAVARLARENGVLASLNELVTKRIHQLEVQCLRKKGPQREESLNSQRSAIA
jgi:2-dehydropantoate 2-reductase